MKTTAIPSLAVRFLCATIAPCHGQFGQGGMGSNLRNGSPNDDDIRDAVLNGTRTGMPSFRGLLGECDIDNLTEYIDSMRSDE